MNTEDKIFFIDKSEVIADLETKLKRKLTEKEIERAHKYFGNNSGFAQIVKEQRDGFADMFCDEILEDKERGGKEFSFIIDEGYIRDEVENYFEAYGVEREMLSISEIENVFYALVEKIVPVVQDSIREVIDNIELMDRNIGSEKIFPHYEIYWRNRNAYQEEWKKVATFKTEKDAHEFFGSSYNGMYDECNIFKVESNGDRSFVFSRGEEYGKGEIF